MDKEKKLCAVTVFNESIEAAENLVLRINNACGRSVRLVGLETQSADTELMDDELIIPRIEAWDMVTALFQREEGEERL